MFTFALAVYSLVRIPQSDLGRDRGMMALQPLARLLIGWTGEDLA